MTPPRATARALLATAWVAALLVPWWLPLQDGPTTTLRDDAYYVFVWVRSMLAGDGPTVSAGVPTSGVQPLWALVLVPFGWLTGVDCLPELAPRLGLVLHAATALLCVAVGRGRPLAWGVALLHLTNPYLLREARNGQETALTCLCLLLLWRHRRGSAPTFVLHGTLAVVARVDLAAVVVALAVARRGWRGLGLGLAPLMPWVGLNLLLGGSLTPHSGLPMPWHVWETFAAGGPDLAGWLQRLWHYGRPALLGGPFEDVAPVGLGALTFLAVRRRLGRTAGVAVAAVAGLDLLRGASTWTPLVAGGLLVAAPARRRGNGSRWVLGLLLAAVAIVVLHDLLRQYPRAYYFAPLGVLGSLALLRLRSVPLLLAAAAAQVLLVRPQEDSLTGQAQMVLAGEHLAAVLPAGAAVGCFNSGIVTWLHRGPVHNLDGLVNPHAFAALRECRLAAWLDGQGVDWLLDSPHEFAPGPALHRRGRYFGEGFAADADLVPVCAFDVEGCLDRTGGARAAPFVLFARRGRASSPTLPAARVLDDDGASATVLLPCAGTDGLVVHVGQTTRTLDVTSFAPAVITRIPRDRLQPTRIATTGGTTLLELAASR